MAVDLVSVWSPLDEGWSVGSNERQTATAAPSSNTSSVSPVAEHSGKVAYTSSLCPISEPKLWGTWMRHLKSPILMDRSYECRVVGCESLFTRRDAPAMHKKLVHDLSKTSKAKENRNIE